MTEKSDGNLTLADLNASIQGFAKLLLALTACTSIIGGAAWFMVSPYLTPYLDRITAIEGKFDTIEKALLRIETNGGPKGSVEIKGVGIVVMPGPFRAGSAVPIGYWMRRNEQCSARITVRLFSAQLGRFDTRLTYEIPTTPADRSGDFQFFVVDVRIPKETTPGRYMYQPVINPVGCSNNAAIVPPPSEFFEVIS